MNPNIVFTWSPAVWWRVDLSLQVGQMDPSTLQDIEGFCFNDNKYDCGGTEV